MYYALENVRRFVDQNHELVGVRAGEILRRAEEASKAGIFHSGVLRSVITAPGIRNKFISEINTTAHQEILATAIALSKIPSYDEVKDFIVCLMKSPAAIDMPCNRLFHVDIDGIHLCIGKPIQERFGLENCSVACHAYSSILKEKKDSFYQRYPGTILSSDSFTLEHFCKMIHNVILVNNGQEMAAD